MFKAFLIAMLLLPSAVMAEGYPDAQCVLNGDKSSVLMIASNPDDKAYTCIASCRANARAQKAFTIVDCKFNLAKNGAEKTVCSKDGGAPNFFTTWSPTKFTCAPK